VFEINYFRSNPLPFYTLAKDMFPGRWRPTPTHFFIKLLEEKNCLLRHFTQNIDTLERVAGVSPHLIVEAHGSFGEAGCISCEKEFPIEQVEKCIFEESAEIQIPKCPDCDGLVKPKITFFGENLPARFFQCLPDLPKADVLLVIGTSLAVHPFAALVDRVRDSCPRVLFNRELVGPFEEGEKRDVFVAGDCDVGIMDLVKLLEWEDDFLRIQKEGNEKFDREKEKAEK
jgi:NAD-dependent SIR2 family protein deacetylase